MLQIEGNTVQERFLSAVKSMNLKFPVAKIAEKTGYGEPTVSTYLKKKEPSEKFLRSFSEAFNIDYLTLAGSPNGSPSPIDEVAAVDDIVNDENLSKKIIYSLAESNKRLSEANYILARNNERLIDKMEATTTASNDDRSEIPLNVQERLSEILEVIADVGTGKRWKSKQQAIEELNKLVVS